MNLLELHLTALRQRRAECLRDYANRTGIAPRKDARMWARFYGNLIRKIERMDRERST